MYRSARILNLYPIAFSLGIEEYVGDVGEALLVVRALAGVTLKVDFCTTALKGVSFDLVLTLSVREILEGELPILDRVVEDGDAVGVVSPVDAVA